MWDSARRKIWEEKKVVKAIGVGEGIQMYPKGEEMVEGMLECTVDGMVEEMTEEEEKGEGEGEEEEDKEKEKEE